MLAYTNDEVKGLLLKHEMPKKRKKKSIQENGVNKYLINTNAQVDKIIEDLHVPNEIAVANAKQEQKL